MRPQTNTLIDRFELAFPIAELPLPAVERYRVPMTSLYLEVDFEDADDSASFSDERESSRGVSTMPPSGSSPQSDRYLRARCWVSEE